MTSLQQSIRREQTLSHGTRVAQVGGNVEKVDYLCKMINTHEHCNVEYFYNFGNNSFDIRCLRNNSLCRSVLLSFKNTPIFEGIKLEEY